MALGPPLALSQSLAAMATLPPRRVDVVVGGLQRGLPHTITPAKFATLGAELIKYMTAACPTLTQAAWQNSCGNSTHGTPGAPSSSRATALELLQTVVLFGLAAPQCIIQKLTRYT